MNKDDEAGSVMEQGADDLGRMVDGLAGLLMGKSAAGENFDPEEPVFSESVDQAIQELGTAVGNVLLAAGDHLQRTSGDEPAPVDEAEPVTPLVHGARSLSRGLVAMAGEVLGSLQTDSEPEPSADPTDESTEG